LADPEPEENKGLAESRSLPRPFSAPAGRTLAASKNNELKATKT
jgi:hypothetical protein